MTYYFNRTFCDCCVCPMKSVCEQLIDCEVNICTISAFLGGVKISDVEDFNVIGTLGGTPICIPISRITGIFVSPSKTINLKPIKKDVKGECACIEESATNKFEKEKSVEVIFPCEGQRRCEGTVNQVGEGIVIVSSPSEQCILSTCQVDAAFLFQQVSNSK
ncbi:hypothetical protein [Chengkuizengella marina]|uniref:Uncharacterized protein n=1 Tax=Chengkuizengella marina TaxID=2507566 RepID=A0A6N9Q0K1_9BACL|nr:hypothetical protein [Chengkuizengella marina]NBI28253.1 hypothetical protein [Chengkuizengella marina]